MISVQKVPGGQHAEPGAIHGYSPAHVRGFHDGKASRQTGKPPSMRALIGIDEYSQGFRAGFFERDLARENR